MLFNSPEFAIFFAVVLALYWRMATSYRLQNLFLVVASYVFYGWWDVRFLYLAILSTLLDFYCALMIDVGWVSRRSRLIGSLNMLASAFFLVTLNWHAVSVTRSGLHLTTQLDWPRLLGDRFGWGIFGASAIAVIVANVLGTRTSRLETSKRRKLFITLSVTGQLTVLGFFKYFNFFTQSFETLARSTFGVTPGPLTLNIVLPVGISFYTFQTMSYTIDVYRRVLPASRSLLEFASFVSFFPQLVAGPIERARQMLPQFRRRRVLTSAAVHEAMWLIAWGLFKKMVVADNVATIVNNVFGPYDRWESAAVAPADGMRLLLAVLAFAIQIYGDFSGYTDIARGTAKLLGFDLMINFDHPYFAINPSDFWRRWHISLSGWLRDYLYISLGGNRGGMLRTYRNLFLTMLLGGLWHGASWTFVLWGAFHGLLLVTYRALGLGADKADRPRLEKVLMGVVMFQLTCFGWLLFRARNLTTVALFTQSIVLSPHWSPEAVTMLKDIAFFSWFLVLVEFVQFMDVSQVLARPRFWFLRLNAGLIIVMSLLAFASTKSTEFIYFEF